jgi:uncharacterized protein YdhG (YjbR/CyaY superfamily)
MQIVQKFKTVDEYISSFPPSTKNILKELRNTIRQAAPDAKESIGYNMPAYKLNGPVVYFAAYKNHIGFYPIPSGIEAFKKELSVYKMAKGSVQFPIDEPLPLKLIRDIVKFRVMKNKESQTMKKNK